MHSWWTCWANPAVNSFTPGFDALYAEWLTEKFQSAHNITAKVWEPEHVQHSIHGRLQIKLAMACLKTVSKLFPRSTNSSQQAQCSFSGYFYRTHIKNSMYLWYPNLTTRITALVITAGIESMDNRKHYQESDWNKACSKEMFINKRHILLHTKVLTHTHHCVKQALNHTEEWK